MKEGWEYKKLGEVATIINGKNQKAVENPNGQYPICGSGGIMGYATDFLCPEQTTIIGRKGNINRPIYMESKFWNVDTAFGIVANQSFVLPRYLYYFCVDFNFEKLNKAVTIPSLVKSDLLKIDMLVPPLSEQQRSVEELDLLSGIVEKKKEQLKELDNLAQSIFYDMFGDPVTNEKGWEVKKLGEICETSSGGTPSKAHNEYYQQGTIPWLRSGEVAQGFIYDTELYITEEGMKNSSAKIFPIETVVVAMYGATVGQVGVLKKEMTTNQAVCGILPNSYYNSTFLLYFLRGIKPLYLKVAAGGAQPNISQGVIKNTRTPIIQMQLQQQFASKVEAIEQQKELIKQSIKEVETLFNSRMDYYFN